MSVANVGAPKPGRAANFSDKKTAAMALLGHDTGGIDNFTDEVTRDPEIIALRAKISVTQEDRLTETQAEVSLTLETGGMRRLRHDLLAPMEIDTRRDKLKRKAASLLGQPHADALWGAAQGIALRDLTDQLVMS